MNSCNGTTTKASGYAPVNGLISERRLQESGS